MTHIKVFHHTSRDKVFAYTISNLDAVRVEQEISFPEISGTVVDIKHTFEYITGINMRQIVWITVA